MKGKIIAFLICMSVFVQIAAADDLSQFEQSTIDGTMTDSQPDNDKSEGAREKFVLDVGMLSEKQLKSLNGHFTKLDLREYANRDIKDEVAGDHQGGWSDQGDNDLRQFDKFGSQEMLGIPFTFINPEENGGRAVLGLRGQNDTGLPTSVTIPVNKTTAGAYFVHASPYCSGTCGTYTWVYEDGTESYMDIVQNEHICDFWGQKSYDFVRPVWTVTKSDGSLRSLYLFAMNNPHPEKRVESLRLETEGGGPFIMIMAITLTDIGPYLTKTASAEFITTTTFGWYEYEQPDEEKAKDSAIDFSSYLDAPAGKHGALKTEGERFVFEDGTAAAFWGADISGEACFPDKAKAEKIASRIARLGINLIRFSKFDEAIIADGNTTRLDSEKLDKLSYFISKLEEKGIYSYFSLLSERKLREGDGIENYADFSEGYGIDAFFDSRLISLQKKFITELMQHKNPYTGVSVGSDKSVVMAELAGSLSLFDYSDGYARTAFANKSQYENAKKLFNEFLAQKYKNTDALKKVWMSVYDKNDYETVEEGTVELKANFKNPLVSEGCKSDTAEFFSETLKKYYNEMKSAFAGSGILITLNSNSPNSGTVADTMANMRTDFVTRTFYNAKTYGKSDKITVNSVFDQYTSMTKSYDNIIADFAKSATSDKPYIANWGSAMPNLYFSEASLMMAAFAGQKGWTAIQHSFANENYSDINYIDDFYSIYNNPVRLAAAAAAASIFYTSAAEEKEVFKENTEGINKLKSSADLNTEQIFSKNIRIDFSDTADTYGKKTSPKVIKTDTIYQNPSIGLFEVRGSKTEALSGFLTEKEEMPSFAIETDNSFVTAALTAVDGGDIKSSERYLVTVLGSNQNYKSRVNLIRNRYEQLGEEKIVVESITGTFVLKQKGDFEVYPLTSSGERKHSLSVSKDRNGYTKFALSSANEAIQYEIIKK